MVSHQHHDKCIAARNILKTKYPELYAKATASGPGNGTTPGTSAHELKLDLDALDAMASSFTTGQKVGNAQQRRAARLVAQLVG